MCARGPTAKRAAEIKRYMRALVDYCLETTREKERPRKYSALCVYDDLYYMIPRRRRREQESRTSSLLGVCVSLCVCSIYIPAMLYARSGGAYIASPLIMLH